MLLNKQKCDEILQVLISFSVSYLCWHGEKGFLLAHTSFIFNSRHSTMKWEQNQSSKEVSVRAQCTIEVLKFEFLNPMVSLTTAVVFCKVFSGTKLKCCLLYDITLEVFNCLHEHIITVIPRLQNFLMLIQVLE